METQKIPRRKGRKALPESEKKVGVMLYVTRAERDWILDAGGATAIQALLEQRMRETDNG